MAQLCVAFPAARLRINGIRVRIGDSDQNRSLTIAQVVHQAQEELGVDWVIQQDGLVPECLTIAPSASHPSLIERPFIAPEGIEEVCVDRKCAEAVLKVSSTGQSLSRSPQALSPFSFVNEAPPRGIPPSALSASLRGLDCAPAPPSWRDSSRSSPCCYVQGADVFAPGVLATSGGFRSGALAAVFGITDGDSITRGSLLNPARDRLNGEWITASQRGADGESITASQHGVDGESSLSTNKTPCVDNPVPGDRSPLLYM